MDAPGATPSTVEIGPHRLRLTNLEKVLYPATGTTKAEVVRWYADAAVRLAALAHDRPVTRKRWPDGVAADPFFEKNLPRGAPDWVSRVRIAHSDRDVDYPLIPQDPTDALATLVWFAQQGALELHVPQWRVGEGAALPPDRLVVDLDPGPGTGLAECSVVAVAARELLAGDGLTAYAATSGSKGMQLYAPLAGSTLAGAGADVVSEHAKSLAQRLTRDLPDLVVWRMTKDLRLGKVFVDWSQNNGRKTTIAPWSLRGREFPCVAAPRGWDEVGPSLAQLSLDEARERLDEPDPWGGALDDGA
jgi:bifunctional non-homologous end joining protein LigD